MSRQEEWESWVASRPPCVQALAREFPVGTMFIEPTGFAWVIGYTEGDELILSRENPFVDWGRAVAARFYCDLDHVRERCKGLHHEHTTH